MASNCALKDNRFPKGRVGGYVFQAKEIIGEKTGKQRARNVFIKL